MEDKSSNQIPESASESAHLSPSPQSNDVSKKDLISGINIITKIGPKALAIGLTVVYISGFLVLNSYLNRFGIMEFDIISSRYLVPGAIFIFYLICFYLFAGRNIVLGKKWVQRLWFLNLRIELSVNILTPISIIDHRFMCSVYV